MDHTPDTGGSGVLRYAVAPITEIVVRDTSANGDNTWTMAGYAAIFDKLTTLYDGRFVQIDEKIDPRAFDNVFANQRMGEADGVVHYNLGHDMNRAVAATDVPWPKPGSLKLSVDEVGLPFVAKVSRDDPDGVALAVKMRDGVVRQASFAFTIAGRETTTIEDEETGRTLYSDTITSVGHLYDVCACAQGAYSQTVSGLRTYARALGHPELELVEAVTVTVEQLDGAGSSSAANRGDVDIEIEAAQLMSLRHKYGRI